MLSILIMRQEESVGRNARCVSIIEKEEGKKGTEREERGKSLAYLCKKRRRERDGDWMDNRRMPKPRAKTGRRQAQVCATIYGKYRRHTQRY